MGRHCGFKFLKLVDNKLTPVKVVPDDYEEDKLSAYIWIDGRCDATDIFLEAVYNKESPKKNSWLSSEEEMTADEKYSAYLLLNHKELDNFVEEREADADRDSWFYKYFYVGLEEFEKLFNFEAVHREQKTSIERYKADIEHLNEEIEKLRTYQMKAETDAAFKGFQKEIDKTKESINNCIEMIEYLETDDYDYNHYWWIEEGLKQIREIIKKDPDIIVVAFGND